MILPFLFRWTAEQPLYRRSKAWDVASKLMITKKLDYKGPCKPMRERLISIQRTYEAH